MAGKRYLFEDHVVRPLSRFFDDFDPRFDPRVKEQERLKELRLDLDHLLPDVPTARLSDFEGESFITSMSDRTAGGETLRGLKGVELKRPIDLLGGQDYMFDPRSAGQVWASAPNPVNQISSLANALPGDNPLFLPWRMAPTGGDFAHMTGETMLAYASSAMNKKNKRMLDRSIKSLIPDWPGVDDPASIEAFRNAPDSVRKRLKGIMDVGFRDLGGLNIGEARLAVSDPLQLGAPDAGLQNVGRIDTRKPILAESGHPSYPAGIPGEGVARLEGDIPVTELLGPGTTRFDEGRLVTDDWAAGRGMDPANPGATDVRALQMKPYGGVIDESLLRRLADRGYQVGAATGAVGLGALGGSGEAEAGPGRLAADLGLDMARNARLGRAREGGFDMANTLYHGTFEDIDAFDPGDIGVHLGTREQALNRLADVTKNRAGHTWGTRATYSDNLDPGANVVPTYARMENTLEARDFGEWNNSAVLAEGLAEFVPNREVDLFDIDVEAKNLKSQFEDNVAWVDSQENRELLDEIRGILEWEGYDSVSYPNLQEGEGLSYVVLDPANIRSVNAAFDPAKRESADILAGVGGTAVVGGGALATSNSSEASTGRPSGDDDLQVPWDPSRFSEAVRSYQEPRQAGTWETLGALAAVEGWPRLERALNYLEYPVRGGLALGRLATGGSLDEAADIARQPVDQTAEQMGGWLLEQTPEDWSPEARAGAATAAHMVPYLWPTEWFL